MTRRDRPSVDSAPVDHVPAVPAKRTDVTRLSKISGVAVDVDSLRTTRTAALIRQV
jgi:hypothetical protein